uniref:Retrotransposon gag domain-containing protein n=1 Tax=Knipowitschia caucasica TaxID=637954 RepID=A0AAV2M4I5_KNICA
MSDNEGANQANAVAGGMAAAMLGTLLVFDSQAQTWEEYCQVLGHFFEANNITDAGRKRAILLSSVGSKTYSLMRNLLSPDKPGDKSFTELTNLLQSHFNPKPSEIVQRFKFISRTRTANETVTEYVAVLRELAQHCNYGDKLKEMLRDRLVCGNAEDRIQRRLLAEPELTFEEALKIAQAIETANRDVRDLQPTLDSAAGKDATPMTVHKVGTENKRQSESITIWCFFQSRYISTDDGRTAVAVYLEDILLTGRSDYEHLETLNEVLRRLQEAGSFQRHWHTPPCCFAQLQLLRFSLAPAALPPLFLTCCLALQLCIAASIALTHFSKCCTPALGRTLLVGMCNRQWM